MSKFSEFNNIIIGTSIDKVTGL